MKPRMNTNKHKGLMILFSVLCLLPSVTRAALNANTVWEVRTTGAQASGGGFRWLSLVDATYRWTASAGGTNEYYCELAAGGNPSLTEAKCATTDGTFNLDANGTLGSLTVGQWDWGDNDALGFSTVYVRLDDGTDPDTKATGFVQIGSGGGYDYTQQAAAQLSLTDLDHGAGSSTLTSAIGGFTALMVGNIIHITSGTNFTVGWYEITAYTSSNQVTVDRSLGASAGTANGVGAVGGAHLIGGTLDDEFGEMQVAGNTTCIAAGTYTVGEHVNVSTSGTTADPKIWTGYTTVRGDATVGTNRPLIACGAWLFRPPAYSIISNLRYTSTNAEGVFPNQNCSLVNCKFENTLNGIALTVQEDHRVISCEAIAPNNTAMSNSAGPVLIENCYIHDSVTGVGGTMANTIILSSIIDTCTTGIACGAQINVIAIGNTIYNCTTGISGTTSGPNLFINNIITGCTTGASWTTFEGLNRWDYNCWNNTTDVNNVTKGAHDVTGNPLLTDPANADFTLAAGSPCFNTGLKPSSDIGLP